MINFIKTIYYHMCGCPVWTNATGSRIPVRMMADGDLYLQMVRLMREAARREANCNAKTLLNDPSARLSINEPVKIEYFDCWYPILLSEYLRRGHSRLMLRSEMVEVIKFRALVELSAIGELQAD